MDKILVVLSRAKVKLKVRAKVKASLTAQEAIKKDNWT
jgi:hypothetical protein